MYYIKRFLCIILIFILLATTSLQNISLTISAQTVTMAFIEGEYINVRSAPSTKATVLEQISYTSVSVINKQDNAEGTWYQITYQSGSSTITGYIFYDASYIRIVSYNPDASFDEKLNSFPVSYHNSLKTLHAAYPNWNFVPEYINLSFKQAVEMQSTNMRKQVEFSDASISWCSMGPGAYNWLGGTWVNDNGGWTAASREIIAYYMDPRNFLSAKEIFQFMKQTYSQLPSEEDVKKIVSGTFLANGYPTFAGDTFGGSYIKLIIKAGEQTSIDPCVLASLILQEQGSKGTSDLISGKRAGYEGYYNFFNISASGPTKEDVIKNGLEKAKNENWSTIPASIIGGAALYKKNYIARSSSDDNNPKNQNTYYYQNFNVHNPNELWHQYAQAIHDSNSKGSILGKAYFTNANYSFTFRIPVYVDMPETAVPKPEKNSKRNNYYFSNVVVNGLTPTFNMFTYSYDLTVNEDTTVYATLVPNSLYAGESSYALKVGDNKVALKVKSETGYITDYVININATKDCTLYVNTTGTTTSGDTNGDGKIDIVDLANVRLYMLDIYAFNEYQKTAADTNKDGKVDILDLANIRLHLLGLYTIK